MPSPRLRLAHTAPLLLLFVAAALLPATSTAFVLKRQPRHGLPGAAAEAVTDSQSMLHKLAVVHGHEGLHGGGQARNEAGAVSMQHSDVLAVPRPATTVQSLAADVDAGSAEAVVTPATATSTASTQTQTKAASSYAAAAFKRAGQVHQATGTLQRRLNACQSSSTQLKQEHVECQASNTLLMEEKETCVSAHARAEDDLQDARQEQGALKMENEALRAALDEQEPGAGGSSSLLLERIDQCGAEVARVKAEAKRYRRMMGRREADANACHVFSFIVGVVCCRLWPTFAVRLRKALTFLGRSLGLLPPAVDDGRSTRVLMTRTLSS